MASGPALQTIGVEARRGKGIGIREADADCRLNLVAGNLRNLRDIFRIGLEHRFGGRLS